MKRVVIADAGPLIALASIGKLDLLPRLFGSVSITTQVAQELITGGPFPDSGVLQAALSQTWLSNVNIADLLPDDWLDQCKTLMNLYQIDMGESSAMVLAGYAQAQGDTPLLVMDDFRGRVAVQHARISMIGTAGLLLLAKQVAAIPSVKPLLLAMRQNGYFLSDRLIEVTSRQAGELD